MHEPSGGGELPYVDLNLTHVDVDLTGLADFRRLLQHELESNMRPAVSDIYANHGAGVAFGARIVGAGVQDARQRYHEALVISTQNLAAYMQTSEVLIAAIEHVTNTYRDSDLTASAITEAINKAAAAQAPARARATTQWPANRGPLE
jgi:hypothetical protein